MLIRVLQTIRAYGAEVFTGAVIAWIALLALGDMVSALLPTWDEPDSVAYEETASASPAKTGCVDVGGIEVCD